MNQWILVRKGADYQALGEQFHIDPLVARIIRNRGVETPEDFSAYLHGTMDSIPAPLLLKDMGKACQILLDKIEQQKFIRVIGDYDIDGVCATAILLKGLQYLGAKADGVIPHRIKDGYGLNRELIKSAGDDLVDTILTCDNGISARDEIAYAKELGMTVIVTDHHEVPYVEENGKKNWLVPDADAVVDPKQEDCEYPFSGICGANVAYKLVAALVNEYRKRNSLTVEQEQEWEMLNKELLQLAAFATVGDIMELKGENRTLVKEGLRLMKDTKCVGLKALLCVNGIYGNPVSAYHLGFILGPCLNATGRIDTAVRALDLLMTKNDANAMLLAGELKSMNDSRKAYTEQGTLQAVEQIEQGLHDGCSVYVIYLPDCHESIAGIVAGRIREKYHRPTLVVTRAEEGLKGSGRSIETYSMYEELSRVKDVFTKYGGHSQAAGFSLPAERLDELRRRLNENCTLTESDFREKVYIDADMPFHYVTPELLNQFNLLEPFGNGNSKPLFARKNVTLLSGKMIGSAGKVGKYCVKEDNSVTELTLFRDNAGFKEFLIDKYGKEMVEDALKGKNRGITFSVIYYPQWNEYQGKKTIQYIIQDYC